MSQNRGLKALEERVQHNDLCTFCGACMHLCPYIRTRRGRWFKIYECDLSEGRCFDYCPRSDVNLDAIHRKIFGESCKDVETGQVKEVFMARAADRELRNVAQNGGVVSALMGFCLNEGILDAAVLTGRDAEHLPEGRVVRTPDEVSACSGSSYVASPTLAALNKGPWKQTERVGIVGVPCQVLALAKMRASSLMKRPPVDKIGLVVGLFCTWALEYQAFVDFIRSKAQGKIIRKVDITPPPEPLLKVITDGRIHDVPVDDIRGFIRPTCRICLDMTAELSDLSVGTVEGIDGWNTVFLRTDRGLEVFRKAQEAHVLEIQSLPEENLKHLKRASLLKKRRALKALKERGFLDGGYITLPPDLIKKIVSKTEEALL